MKLEIELDLNKIDYDTINKQIAEKIEALNIKDMYEIESKIDGKISNFIQNEVDMSYNSYIDKYWHGPSPKGAELIESKAKEEIERRCNEAMNIFFANNYDEDKMKEVILKIIPNVITYILFSRIESSLFSTAENYFNLTRDMVRNEIECILRR